MTKNLPSLPLTSHALANITNAGQSLLYAPGYTTNQMHAYAEQAVAERDAEIERLRKDAERLHVAVCQAVALMNRLPEMALRCEGREAHTILRQALADHAEIGRT